LTGKAVHLLVPERKDSHFLVVWEFLARPGSEARFEEIYGPTGAWARLFICDANYLGSDLWHDVRETGRYLTLDYWRSEADYDAFHDQYQTEYDAIDRECESLTEREVLIGRFTKIPGSPPL